jgi:hypothetical protein
MKLLSRAILAAVLLCSFGRAAHAQGAVDEPWTFTIGANGSFEGNALFVAPEEGEREFANQVITTLGRSWKLRRGDARLAANASQSFYRDSTVLNDFRYNVSGGFTHALTRRLTWSAASAVSSGLARDSELLTDTGSVLPTASALTSNSSSSFSYMLSRRSQVSWSFAQQGVGFSSALFSGGSSVGSVLSFTRQMTSTQTIGVTQEYQRTFADDESASIYGLLGTWSATVGGGWSVNASLGVRPFTVPGESGYRMSTGVSAGLTKPVRPGQTFGVSYNQSVEQTFGLDHGNQPVQTVTATYGMALRRNLSSSFSGSYSRGTNPLTPDLATIGAVANVSLSYQVLPNLGLSIGSSVYSRTDEPAARVTSYRTFVSASYGTSWR